MSSIPFSDELSGLELYPGLGPAALPPSLRRVLPRTAQVVNGNNAVTQNVAQGGAPTSQSERGESLEQTLARLRKRAEDAQAELSNLRKQGVDVSGIEQYGRERAMGGQDAMLNALAAQFAGERFSGVQDAMLKRSLAAQQDMKLGQGVLGANGKFIRDPYALRDAEEKRLADDSQFYDKYATTVAGQIASRDERRAAADERAARWEQDRRDRRERAAEADQLRRDLAAGTRASADATRAAAADQRTWALEDRMGNDYRQEVKDPAKIVSTYENLKAAPASAAGDISFIFQYMKMLDPASVVREGEFATAQNSGGVTDTVRNLYNRALNGQRLNPQQRQEFLNAAGALATNAQQSIATVQKRYTENARRRGIDPRNIFDGAGGAASGGGNVPVNY